MSLHSLRRATISVCPAVLLVVALATIVSGACVEPPPDLVSWWRLEGNADDAMHVNHGDVFAGLPETLGFVGNALYFDGFGYVVVPHDESLNVQQFTIDAWVNPATINGTIHMIVNKEDFHDITRVEYELGIRGHDEPGLGSIPPGNLAFYIGEIDGLPDEYRDWVDGNHGIPLDQWTHVALTFDGQNARVLVNGDITREIGGLSGSVYEGSGTLRIGARSSTHHRFVGTIDEVDLFSRALDPGEVQSIYDAGSAGKCLPTLAQPLESDRAWGRIKALFRS